MEHTGLDKERCCTRVSGSEMVLSSMLVHVRVSSLSTLMAESSLQIRRRWSCRELQGVSCRSFTRFQNPVAKIFVNIVLFSGLSAVISVVFTTYPPRTSQSPAGDLRNNNFFVTISPLKLAVSTRCSLLKVKLYQQDKLFVRKLKFVSVRHSCQYIKCQRYTLCQKLKYYENIYLIIFVRDIRLSTLRHIR